MKGILNLLAKAKLVELSDEERVESGLLNEEAPATVEKVPVEVVEPEVPPALDLPPLADDQSELRPLEDIYAAAKIPAVPFSAEKLLKLLDGLKALDAVTRKAAVIAMDAADDNWQISDCLADAEHKIAALNSYRQHLAARVVSAEQEAVEKMNATRASLESTSTEIRKQIAELEQLLEREITRTAQQTTALEAALRNEREAAAREGRRIDGEIEKLNEMIRQFTAA